MVFCMRSQSFKMKVMKWKQMTEFAKCIDALFCIECRCTFVAAQTTLSKWIRFRICSFFEHWDKDKCYITHPKAIFTPIKWDSLLNMLWKPLVTMAKSTNYTHILKQLHWMDTNTHFWLREHCSNIELVFRMRQTLLLHTLHFNHSLAFDSHQLEMFALCICTNKWTTIDCYQRNSSNSTSHYYLSHGIQSVPKMMVKWISCFR